MNGLITTYNNMEDQLITFETAILAKEKGFDEYCNYTYEGNILSKTQKSWKNSEDLTEYAVCTQSLLQRWLREIYNLNIDISCVGYDNYDKHFSYRATVNLITKDIRTGLNPKITVDCTSDIKTDGFIFRSYENALEKGLQKALTLI